MKKFFLFLSVIISFYSHSIQAQSQTYQAGEVIKLRLHYGWFNASYATLTVDEQKIGDTSFYHVKGHGRSTGLLHAFFKVNDTYESYINKETQLPLKFRRKINEGGHKKNKIIYFNQKQETAKVRDIKNGETENYTTKGDVQDMISAFYYLRNQIADKLKKKGDSVILNMFFDQKNYKFKTVYLGRETIKTKFGDIETLKLRPYVQAGRVFKKKESLTVWISADRNKIPVKIKAKLAVGSLTADLDGYENLKYPFGNEE